MVPEVTIVIMQTNSAGILLSDSIKLQVTGLFQNDITFHNVTNNVENGGLAKMIIKCFY
jgi:hypothetical protein